jgi:hypothetical protein
MERRFSTPLKKDQTLSDAPMGRVQAAFRCGQLAGIYSEVAEESVHPSLTERNVFAKNPLGSAMKAAGKKSALAILGLLVEDANFPIILRCMPLKLSLRPDSVGRAFGF